MKVKLPPVCHSMPIVIGRTAFGCSLLDFISALLPLLKIQDVACVNSGT